MRPSTILKSNVGGINHHYIKVVLLINFVPDSSIRRSFRAIVLPFSLLDLRNIIFSSLSICRRSGCVPADFILNYTLKCLDYSIGPIWISRFAFSIPEYPFVSEYRLLVRKPRSHTIVSEWIQNLRTSDIEFIDSYAFLIWLIYFRTRYG